MKTGAAWLLLAALVFLPALGVRAEQVYGSVQVVLPPEAAGVELTLYKAAQAGGTGYYYAEDSGFAGSGVPLNGLETAEEAAQAAEQLAAWAADNEIEGIMQTAQAAGESSQARWESLEPGVYLIVQTGGQEQIDIQNMLVSVPNLAGGTAVYDVVVDAKTEVPDGMALLDKVDDAGGAVAGAVFRLEKKTYVTGDGELPEGTETGSDGGGRYYWKALGTYETDGNGQILVQNLEYGTYRFMEESAPGGYIIQAAPVYCNVNGAGAVEAAGGRYAPGNSEVPEVEARNDRTKVSVNKTDEEGNPVAGALLSVRDAVSGEVVSTADGTLCRFETAGEPYEIFGLPAGDYLLREDEAPAGYETAADVPFTVSGETSDTVTVTMVDEDKLGTLSVTKRLTTADGTDLVTPEATFFVALFADEARTQMVSQVVPVEFTNMSSQTVQFLDLPLDRVYYVSETDETGRPLDNGTIGDGGVFGAYYGDGNTVQLTIEAPDGALTFENIFSEVPKEYYYEGVLTITKRVLRGGELQNSNETFYAGIFEDPEYTSRVGDVIELAMDGSSELSVEVPVVIGENADDTKTYYVTETDADGVPVAGAEGFKYEVSVDKTSVTMSPDHDEETVVITNEEPEEEPETGSLSVTKYLKLLSGEDLTASKGTFYAALFADEARTQRISGVMPLEFINASEQTVEFTGLPLGTVYYVSETDEMGNPIDSGTTGEDGDYSAVFPDGNKKKLTVKAPEKSIEFENVFPEQPPEYYVEGELTITKRVLRNGALSGTSETFYAGIFEDPDFTARYGDVIGLAMNGSSELSVTVPVTAGQNPDDSRTYYVTETDADGVPVAGSASFAYTVSVDKTSVTLSGSHDTEAVVITNSRTERRPDEEPDNNPDNTPDGGPDRTPDTPPTTPTNSVQTGDETPVAQYAVLFAASAAVLTGILFLSVRRRKKTR